MKLAKSLLLGSTTAFVAVAGANAADLPSKKAAPATYVKVCDAYGAGFFNVPGTDTCIKVGGRFRADFAMTGRQDVYASNVFANTNGANVVNGYIYNGALTKSATSAEQGYLGSTATPYDSTLAAYATSTVAAATYSQTIGSLAGYYLITGSNAAAVAASMSSSVSLGQAYGGASSTSTRYGYVVANGVAAKSSNIYGWETRGRVDMESRTPTAYGTVQTVASLRLARTTGILDQVGPAASSSGAGATLEASYLRFAGFTFGVAKDNFSFMPSTFYGAGHWASFANGAKQIAYTAVLGGGISPTLAVQDATDTTLGGVNVLGTLSTTSNTTTANQYILPSLYYTGTPQDVLSGGTPAYSYNKMPQINARVDFDQSWGTVSAMGAVGQAVAQNSSGVYNTGSKTTYAAGMGVKLNLPQLAAGDVLWLNGGVANGMTEYTTNWTSFKSSDTKRNVGGYVVNHPSWAVTTNGIELVKSWNAAAVFTHFWTPNWRHSFLATYGAVNGTTTTKQLAWGQTGAFGDAKVWNVGTQLAFLPAKDFEIGVDVLYARVAQDIRRLSGTNTQTYNAATATAAAYFQNLGSSYSSNVTRESVGNWTGRLRVERTF